MGPTVGAIMAASVACGSGAAQHETTARCEPTPAAALPPPEVGTVLSVPNAPVGTPPSAVGCLTVEPEAPPSSVEAIRAALCAPGAFPDWASPLEASVSADLTLTIRWAPSAGEPGATAVHMTVPGETIARGRRSFEGRSHLQPVVDEFVDRVVIARVLQWLPAHPEVELIEHDGGVLHVRRSGDSVLASTRPFQPWDTWQEPTPLSVPRTLRTVRAVPHDFESGVLLVPVDTTVRELPRIDVTPTGALHTGGGATVARREAYSAPDWTGLADSGVRHALIALARGPVLTGEPVELEPALRHGPLRVSAVEHPGLTLIGIEASRGDDRPIAAAGLCFRTVAEWRCTDVARDTQLRRLLLGAEPVRVLGWLPDQEAWLTEWSLTEPGGDTDVLFGRESFLVGLMTDQGVMATSYGPTGRGAQRISVDETGERVAYVRRAYLRAELESGSDDPCVRFRWAIREDATLRRDGERPQRPTPIPVEEAAAYVGAAQGRFQLTAAPEPLIRCR